jgi:hypothetical protein
LLFFLFPSEARKQAQHQKRSFGAGLVPHRALLWCGSSEERNDEWFLYTKLPYYGSEGKDENEVFIAHRASEGSEGKDEDEVLIALNKKSGQRPRFLNQFWFFRI